MTEDQKLQLQWFDDLPDGMCIDVVRCRLGERNDLVWRFRKSGADWIRDLDERIFTSCDMSAINPMYIRTPP